MFLGELDGVSSRDEGRRRKCIFEFLSNNHVSISLSVNHRYHTNEMKNHEE